MKYPEIVKTETTYFTLHGWKRGNKRGTADILRYYKTARRAEQTAQKLMADGITDYCMIRKEIVWLRDEKNEYSSSGLYKKYGAA